MYPLITRQEIRDIWKETGKGLPKDADTLIHMGITNDAFNEALNVCADERLIQYQFGMTVRELLDEIEPYQDEIERLDGEMDDVFYNVIAKVLNKHEG